MKPAQLTVFGDENELTKESHEKLCKTTAVEDFFVKSVSNYTSVMENVSSNWFAKITELFQKKDVYDPSVMNDLI